VTPLWIACLKGHLTIVMTLLAKGASVRAVEVRGVRPSMNAYLLRYGASWPQRFLLRFQMDSGCTTLHVASLNGSAPVVTALLGAGAAIDATRVRGGLASQICEHNRCFYSLIMCFSLTSRGMDLQHCMSHVSGVTRKWWRRCCQQGPAWRHQRYAIICRGSEFIELCSALGNHE
jgi:hypothetical protein